MNSSGLFVSINIALIELVEMCPIKRNVHTLQVTLTRSGISKDDKEHVIRQKLFQMTESHHEF